MLSLALHTWNTVAVPLAAQLAVVRGSHDEATLIEHKAAYSHKTLFFQTRLYLRLGVTEVAQVFGIEIAEIIDVEAGIRRFRSPMDLKVVLDQLWLSAQEKHGLALLTR